MVNKSIFLLFVVMTWSSAVYSQQPIEFTDELNWKLLDQEEKGVYSFDNASFDLNSNLPVRYIKKLNLPASTTINDIELQIIESHELINFNHLPDATEDPEVIFDVNDERGRNTAFVSFIPLFKTGFKIHAIDKFKLIINFKSVGKFQARTINFKSESALANGDIYKIAIAQSGMYKLSYDFITNNMNIPAENIENIKIYGNRGGLLPESLSESRIDDLEEVPFIYSGNNNNLSPGESIIFYAEGADTYKIRNEEKIFQKNIYDENNYYFIIINNENRITIPDVDFPQQSEVLFDTYHDYQRYEEDKTNLLGTFTSAQGSGQKWYGDYFGVTRTRNYEDKFDFNDIKLNSDLQFNISFAGRSSVDHSVTFNINDESFTKTIQDVNTGNIESRYARDVSIIAQTNFESNDIKLNISCPNLGDNEGWLDYIEMISEKSLRYNNTPLIFFNRQMQNHERSTYLIENGNNIIVWDITNPLEIMGIKGNLDGNNFLFNTENGNHVREYIAFRPQDINNEPDFVGKIENQNLHAISSATMAIIYHPNFEEEALRLMSYRNNKGINTIAVSCEKLFNEFGSGKWDPIAIRDFSKMLYERDPEYKYLLLFGDASYDFKNLVAGLPDHNFVPVYETKESLHPIEAFPADDYYALLSDNEGNNLKGQLEIAVGRLPVKDQTEAKIVVDKIIRYETDPNMLGDWRLRIGFTADDEDSNTHLRQAERISGNTEDKFPLFNQQKVYFDAYEQESTSGGARYPGASAALTENIFKGQLVLNYLGHGGPKGWAQERVLKVNDILGWDNKYKMPLLITATCSFTGYDDAGLVSAGEYAMLSDRGGAIGLLTTVRAVYSIENERLTAAVFDTIFSQGTELKNLTIGDIMLRSKNNNWQDTARINARKFALIGDPALSLAIPSYKIVTATINEQDINSFSDTLNALEKVKITGYVSDRNGVKANNFNGIIYPTIYDKKTKLTTLRNDSRSRSQEFEVYKSIIFKGAATVTNGEFEFEFIIPKDIDYSIGKGRISYYTINSDNQDAGGHFENFIIGGSNRNELTDQEGPDIELFMNDESFVYGGITDPNPDLFIKLSDNNGINVTGNSIGHDLIAIIDGDNNNPILLNDFYSSSMDDYASGTVNYPLKDLAPGEHTVTVRAWDIANNSSEKMLSFRVVDGEGGMISNMYNYPNPFTTNTQFMFEHDLANANLDILIHIYSLNGKLVRTLTDSKFDSGYRINDISWDGRDDFGEKLGKGIYLYKIKITDQQLNVSRESEFQKLAIL